jgi:hypothetical protein
MVTNSSLNTTTVSSTLVSTSTGLPAWTAALTNGQVVLGSTGATPVAASLTAGTNITLTPGAGSLTIAAGGAAGGGWFLIQTQTASNSATLDFTTGINSTYKNFVFVMNYLVPVTDEVDLTINFSTNAGSAWLTSAVYGYTNNLWDAANNGPSTTNNVGNSAIALYLTGDNNTVIWDIDSEASGGLSGLLWCYDFSNTLNTKMITSDSTWRAGGSATACARSATSGIIEETGAINGVRFLMSSGSISTGSIALYGLKNA